MTTHYHVTETSKRTGTVHFESEGFAKRADACDYFAEIVQNWIGDPDEYRPFVNGAMIRRGTYVLDVRECHETGCDHETY